MSLYYMEVHSGIFYYQLVIKSVGNNKSLNSNGACEWSLADIFFSSLLFYFVDWIGACSKPISRAEARLTKQSSPHKKSVSRVIHQI